MTGLLAAIPPQVAAPFGRKERAMIAHLVRKRLPPRQEKTITCSTCGEEIRTAVHYAVYCMVCGQANKVPPNA